MSRVGQSESRPLAVSHRTLSDPAAPAPTTSGGSRPEDGPHRDLTDEAGSPGCGPRLRPGARNTEDRGEPRSDRCESGPQAAVRSQPSGSPRHARAPPLHWNPRAPPRLCTPSSPAGRQGAGRTGETLRVCTWKSNSLFPNCILSLTYGTAQSKQPWASPSICGKETRISIVRAEPGRGRVAEPGVGPPWRSAELESELNSGAGAHPWRTTQHMGRPSRSSSWLTKPTPTHRPQLGNDPQVHVPWSLSHTSAWHATRVRKGSESQAKLWGKRPQTRRLLRTHHLPLQPFAGRSGDRGLR